MTSHLNNLINLPIRFKESDKSWFDLVIPNLDSFLSINHNQIIMALEENPETIDEWIEYSENKRTSEGAYISQDDNNHYEVGFFDGFKIERQQYFSKKEAVSIYIVKELEHFKKIHR